MLAADKELLESELKKKAIAIQNMELDFFVNNLGTVATAASMLAGFSYSALLTKDSDFNGVVHGGPFSMGLVCYYFATTLAMGSEMMALILATVCRLWGVGLALRGPVGSMRRSVDQMSRYQEWTVKFFGAGLVFFHISAITYSWIAFQHWLLAALVSTGLLLSLALMGYIMHSVRQAFSLRDKDIVHGRLDSQFVRGLEGSRLLHTQERGGGYGQGYGPQGGQGYGPPGYDHHQHAVETGYAEKYYYAAVQEQPAVSPARNSRGGGSGGDARGINGPKAV